MTLWRQFDHREGEGRPAAWLFRVGSAKIGGKPMDTYEAEFMRGGAAAVNALLEKSYPDPVARVEKMGSLEATGRWEVYWHYPSDGGEGPDNGIVMDFAGR